MFRTGFSAHRQEFSTVYTAVGICHTGNADCLLAGSGWNKLIPLASSQKFVQPVGFTVRSGMNNNRYNYTVVNSRTVRLFTESDDNRCCNNTICPPEDKHSTARNMLRIIM